MGTGDIKYGDTFVFLQHMKTGLWLSYQTFETKKRGVGRVEEKKARNVLSPFCTKTTNPLNGRDINWLQFAIQV